MERYREYVDFQLSVDGEGLGLREARQRIADMALDGEAVVDLDVLAIVCIQGDDYINPALLDDAPAQPLDHWWWHLGAVRQGGYPAALLSPSLRAIYRERPKAA